MLSDSIADTTSVNPVGRVVQVSLLRRDSSEDYRQYRMKIPQLASVAALLCATLSSIPVSAADAEADGDFTIGPNYTNAPELTVREGVPRWHGYPAK